MELDGKKRREKKGFQTIKSSSPLLFFATTSAVQE
jgi:hypothetical protein